MPHTTSKPTPTPADIRSAVSKLRTTNIDGLVVDRATGEVIGSYTTHNLVLPPYDYHQPHITQAEHSSYELDEATDVGSIDLEHIETQAESLPEGIIDLDAQRSKRGPKPKVMYNPQASHFKVAHAEHHGWVDDYVHGACMTVGGVTNGKMNVSPSHVLRACMLDEISTEVVKKVIRLRELRTMSDQQARRICQCARFAIEGMELYLERNPTVQAHLQWEVDFMNSYYQGQQAVA